MLRTICTLYLIVHHRKLLRTYMGVLYTQNLYYVELQFQDSLNPRSPSEKDTGRQASRVRPQRLSKFCSDASLGHPECKLGLQFVLINSMLAIHYPRMRPPNVDQVLPNKPAGRTRSPSANRVSRMSFYKVPRPDFSQRNSVELSAFCTLDLPKGWVFYSSAGKIKSWT